MVQPVGIRGFGCYLPRYRLACKEIGAAWGKSGGPSGWRSVASHDEDALTMALEAASEALCGLEPMAVGAIYFASASAPFGEKGVADMLGAALDLRQEIATADFGGGPRAFCAALRAARDALRAGSCRYALVVASELRQAEPGSNLEPLLGDAAAAFVIASGDDLQAEIEIMASVSDEFAPVWRMAGDPFLRTDDEKVATQAFLAGSLRAAKRALELAAREPGEIARVVAQAPDAGSYRALLKASGMAEKFHGRHLLDEVGFAGSAHLPLMLCDALRSGTAGERILAIGAGGGADAMVLRIVRGTADGPHSGTRDAAACSGGPLPGSRDTTGSAGDLTGCRGETGSPGASMARSRRTLDDWLASQVDLSYLDYLRFRGLLPGESGKLDPFASLTAERRDSRETLRLHGKRCGACGAVLYPVRPACRACGASGPFQDVRLGRRGTIVTWTRDHVYPGPGAPLSNVVVDLDDGGRLLVQMCEGEPAIGDPVELTLRRIHEGRGIPHYWWKARSPRIASVSATMPPGAAPAPIAREGRGP